MSFEADLVEFIADELSADVYYYGAPNDAALPCVIISKTSTDVNWSINAKGIISNDFEIQCAGASFEDAITLGNAVTALLENFKGEIGQHTVTLSRVLNDFDTDEPQSESFIRILSLTINYNS